MLHSKLPDVASCLVLDIRLPGLSGLDFQAELAKADIHIPIIFMTGHGDIPMTVRAMKGGAVDFLTKPFRDQDMLDAVVAAIERDRKRREADKIVANLQALFETLTPREREILALVLRAHEQTGSRRTWACRDHREDPSRAHHEEDGREVVGRFGEKGRNARNSSHQALAGGSLTNLSMISISRREAHFSTGAAPRQASLLPRQEGSSFQCFL